MELSLNKIPYNSNSKLRRINLTQDQIAMLKESFDLFDMEKTGFIDAHELKLTLKAFGFHPSKEEIKNLLNKYDCENGKIVYEDYMEIMTLKFSERDPREEALLAFSLFDEENKGKIGIKNLKSSIKELGENLSEDELKAIIEEFDSDKDGFITKDDFMKIMDEYYFD